MICPFCRNDNCLLVEAWSENFQMMGPAVECPNCGMCGPVADNNNDKLAIHIWNLIVVKEIYPWPK